MKKVLTLLAFLALAIAAQAQAPQAFQYQAVVRDNTGNLLGNQNVAFRINIRRNAPNGLPVYSEIHNTTTNPLGLVNLVIGQGVTVDDFSLIDWGNGTYFLQVEMDPSGGAGYVLLSTTQLLSVPYALYAAKAGAVDNFAEIDGDPTNELQNLSLSGNSLSISNGNAVDLSGLQDNDADSTNEIQSISLVGNTLSIANANSVDLSPFNDGDGSPTNEFQSLSLAGNTLSITNGNTVDLSAFVDNDPSPTNEIQSLNLAGNVLSISGGNSITLPGGGGGGTLDQAYDAGGPGVGRVITVDAGAVNLVSAANNAIILDIDHTGTGVCLSAGSTNASNTYSSVQATTNSVSNLASAVIGSSSGAAWGVSGQAEAASTAEAAVYGSNLRTNGGHGVLGIGFNGLVGETNFSAGFGVYGQNNDQVGNPNTDLGIGVAGVGYYGVLGESLYLNQQIAGDYGVFCNGDFAATGAKSFCIDHPLDPANKILRHFSIESNEVLNVYRGNATFDANGEAEVVLPDYFDAINRNFSYQLTPVGAYMPLFVKEKIAGNRFVIGGGQQGMECSWAVTAERHDAYFQQFPENAQPEIEKREGEKGRYFIPSLYGASQNQSLIPNKPNMMEQKKME